MRRTFLFLLLLLAGCQPPPVVPNSAAATSAGVEGVHQLRRVSSQLWSGSRPEGDAGFAHLQRLGIRTVISVDGATPEVALAEKFGIRYVHLPIRYDGIRRERVLLLAKAVRELPGPVYIHCHHGKHRGPAAAAAVKLCLDPEFTPERAEQLLKDAGTDPRYRGLYDTVKYWKRPSSDELDRVPNDFPAISPIDDLATHMVEIDAIWDRLARAKSGGWNNPDSAVADVVLLQEAYREVKRLPVAREKRFADLVNWSEAEVVKLEAALRTGNAEAKRTAFAVSDARCKNCHAECRDNP